MVWHMKGYSIVVISAYFDHGTSLRSGANARNLGSVGSSLKTAQCPWVLEGDYNVSPSDFWRSGRPSSIYCERARGGLHAREEGLQALDHRLRR
eukprot:3334358-Pyramimonas_sp.AAC.1